MKVRWARCQALPSADFKKLAHPLLPRGVIVKSGHVGVGNGGGQCNGLPGLPVDFFTVTGNGQAPGDQRRECLFPVGHPRAGRRRREISASVLAGR